MEFMEFESMEAAFDWMAQQEEAANKVLAPEQKGIGWGDHWIRFEEWGAIFGRVYTEEEVHDTEKALIDKEPEVERMPGELGYILARLRETHERGYRYGWAHSKFYTDGELGDTHIFNMWPIDHTLYEAMKKVNWDIAQLDDQNDQDVLAQLELAWNAWRAHKIKVSGQTPEGPT